MAMATKRHHVTRAFGIDETGNRPVLRSHGVSARAPADEAGNGH
jgi:hypothetical protein